MGLEAALAWKTCTFGLTKKLACKQFHLQKTIELYRDLWELFYSKWTEIIEEIQLHDLILVDKCHICYQIMEKKK